MAFKFQFFQYILSLYQCPPINDLVPQLQILALYWLGMI
jgi:hypothetical protein